MSFRPMDNLNGQLGPFNCPPVAAPTGISNARWSKYHYYAFGPLTPTRRVPKDAV